MSERRPAGPRYGRALAVILPIAVAILWWLSQRGPDETVALGGRLLPWEPSSIESLTLTRGGAQYRIEKNDDGVWRVAGALVDFADAERVGKLLADLTAAEGGALLPGTEPMDRRYEFNGPGAIRLAVFGPGEEPWRLALGAVNPVTGWVYASGAGREACFPVQSELRDRLRALPDEVRTSTLLPSFPLASVQRLTISGAGAMTLRREAGAWWMRWNPGERAGPGSVAGAYQRWYDDRRLEDETGRWLRADDDAISLLLFQTSSLVVRRFVSASEAAPNLADWGLEPPYRRVVMEGPLLRAGTVKERIEIDFGASLDGEVAAARRLENVLLTDDTALKKLELRPADLLNLEVAAYPVVRADTCAVYVGDRIVLGGHRDPALYRREVAVQKGDFDRVDGRQAWVADHPVPGPTVRPKQMNVRLQTVVVSLDRLPILAVFPPQPQPDALASEGRVRIVIDRVVDGQPRRETLLLGTLLPGRLPAGSSQPARDAESNGPAAAWNPETGQLLQVPGAFLATLRNLAI